MIDDLGEGAAGAGGGEGGEGAAGAGAADSGAGAGEGGKTAAPARVTLEGAFSKLREMVGATKGASDPGRPAGAADDAGADIKPVETIEGESAEQLEERLAGMEPAEREAEEARLTELAANDPLIVDLGALRDGEEPIRIAAADQAMADQLRSLKNRAASYEASIALRDEAQGYIAQADELRYEVQLDPAGFLLKTLVAPEGGLRTADAVHVARMMLTQPGVLDQMKDWVTALAAHPEALAQEARLANADRIERVEKVRPQVARMKFENDNARACVRAVYTTVEKITPDSWSREQRDQLASDVTRDLQDLQRSERVSVTDPKRIPKLVESRLSRFGVAPNKGKGGGNGAGAGRPESKTSDRTGPSGQQLRQTDALRRRAAGPGPGAGSPAAGIPKPPAGTKLTGKNNVFDFVRQRLPALRRAP